jgi:hypothetical protein
LGDVKHHRRYGCGAEEIAFRDRDPPVVHDQRAVFGADLAVVASVDGVVVEQVGEVVGPLRCR